MKIIGKHIDLEGVTPGDAEFILSLRLDATRSRFLSRVENDLQAQKTWIEHYQLREQAGEEYYFLIRDRSGERLGAVRVYDFQGDSFCWGSWIMKPGSPAYAAMESALCVYEFAFKTLGFKKCHFDVRKGNDKVVAFHTRFGARIISEDELNYYFDFSQEDYFVTRKKYQKYLPDEQSGQR